LPRLIDDLDGRVAQEIDRLLGLLQTAVDADDRAAIRDAAHQLKGLSSMYGRDDLAAAVRDLETAALSASLATLRDHLLQLQRLLC